MSPFFKIMQLFLMMTGTVLGMLMLLLVTPDIEESMLRAVRRYQRRHRADPILLQTIRETVDGHFIGEAVQMVVHENSFQTSITRAPKKNYPSGGSVLVDESRKTFVPWPNSESCRRFHIHFAKRKSLPMTALVSFPGSGNTWVRYLLETASGVFTGSVYTDRQIISKGFYGEAAPVNCGCTVVQKTHGFSLAGLVPSGVGQRTAEIKQFKGRGILLIRNPYEALISYRNFLYGGHTGLAPHDRFRGEEWESFVLRLAIIWKELAATWINNTRESTVIHFEQLRLEPEPYLRRLLQFLKLDAREDRISCVMSHLEGPFRRGGEHQHQFFLARDPFSLKSHKTLDSVIDAVDKMLLYKGWKRIPKHLYKFYKTKNKSLDHPP